MCQRMPVSSAYYHDAEGAHSAQNVGGVIFRTKSRGERLAPAQRQDLWKPSLEVLWTEEVCGDWKEEKAMSRKDMPQGHIWLVPIQARCVTSDNSGPKQVGDTLGYYSTLGYYCSSIF